MTTIPCARCNREIEESAAFVSEEGSVCDQCQLQEDMTPKLNWFSPDNIVTVALVSGSCFCSFSINGVDYGQGILGVISLLAALYEVRVALQRTHEPTWLRFGRPILLFLAGGFRVAMLLLAMLGSS